MINSDSIALTNDRKRSKQARISGHIRALNGYIPEKCDFCHLLPYSPTVMPGALHNKTNLWVLAHRKVTYSVRIASRVNPFIYNSFPSAAIKKTASLELDSSFEDFEERFFSAQIRFIKLSTKLRRAVLSNPVLNIYPRALFYISASSEQFRIGEELSEFWINGKKKRSQLAEASSGLLSGLQLLLQQEELFPASLSRLTPHVFQILHDVKTLHINLSGDDSDIGEFDFDPYITDSPISYKELWRLVGNFTSIEQLSLAIWKETGCFERVSFQLLFDSILKLPMVKRLKVRFRPQSNDYIDLLNGLKETKHMGHFSVRIDIQTHQQQIFQEIAGLIPRPSDEGIIMYYKKGHTLDFSRSETLILKEECGSFALSEIHTQAPEILLASGEVSSLAANTKELYISNLQLEGFRSNELRKFNTELAKAAKCYSKLHRLKMTVIIYPEIEQDIPKSLFAPLGKMGHLTDLRLEITLVSEVLDSQDDDLSEEEDYFYPIDDTKEKQSPIHYPIESLIEDLEQVENLDSLINFELVIDVETFDILQVQSVLEKVSLASSVRNFLLKVSVDRSEIEMIPSQVKEAAEAVKIFKIKQIEFEPMDYKVRLGFVLNYRRENYWAVIKFESINLT